MVCRQSKVGCNDLAAMYVLLMHHLDGKRSGGR
jgi:hypothetical protein